MNGPVTDDAAAFDLERSTPLGPAKGSGAPASKVRPVESVAAADTGLRDRSRNRKVHLVVPETAFDLLEGSYAATRRSRLIAVVAVGVLMMALVLVVADAFAAVIDQYSAEDRVTNLELVVQDQVEALAKLTTVDGASGSQMRSAVLTRAAQAAQATETETDVRKLLSDLTTSMPVAARWSSIRFEPSSGQKKAAPSAGAASAQVTPPSAPKRARVRVTLNGVVPSYEVASLWIQNLRKLEYLADQSVSWSGNVPNIAFAVTAYIDSPGTARYQTFVDDVAAMSEDAVAPPGSEPAADTAPADTGTEGGG